MRRGSGGAAARAAAWIGLIFVMGLMFGVVRWKTGSIVPTMVMHAAMNGWASAMLVLQMEYGP